MADCMGVGEAVDKCGAARNGPMPEAFFGNILWKCRPLSMVTQEKAAAAIFLCGAALHNFLDSQGGFFVKRLRGHYHNEILWIAGF